WRLRGPPGPSRPDHGNRTQVMPARVSADPPGKGARMSDPDASRDGPDETAPDPAEDLVAPEDVREAERGDGPEADLVVGEEERAERLGEADGGGGPRP